MINQPVFIFYGYISDTRFQQKWEAILDNMPQNIQKHCLKFTQKGDQQRRLLGYHLLQEALGSLNIPASELSHIKRDPFNKPYLPNFKDTHFSLSYSKEISLCAVSSKDTIGVDIEAIRPVNIEEFKDIFPHQIWTSINNANNPLSAFFHYWTLIEAVSKANGDGIVGPIQDIELRDHDVIYNHQSWSPQEIKSIDERYKVQLCQPSSNTIQIDCQQIKEF